MDTSKIFSDQIAAFAMATPKRSFMKRWMNEHKDARVPYVNSNIEEYVNVTTHAIPALFAIVSLFIVLRYAEFVDHVWDGVFAFLRSKTFATCVYNVALVLMFACSALYHVFRITHKQSRLLYIFNRLDHSIIFIFIAASYTPWVIMMELGVGNFYGKVMFASVWMIAFWGVGKVFQNQAIGVTLYLVLGWISILLIYPFSASEGLHYDDKKLVAVLIVGGGILFSMGTIFFQMEGKIPFAHAIWHMFVVAGTACHFIAIMSNLIHLDQPIPYIKAKGTLE